MRMTIILAMLSGVLLAFSFPGFNLEFLAWFAFVPLFFAVKGKKAAVAFLLFYLCGIVFWLLIIYWLIHVTFFGLILMVLYLALYFGVFGFLACRFLFLTPTYYLLTTSAIWVLLEYLRSHLLTGFGWALLGYSQYLTLPAIQIADITGVWGVSFVVMAINIAIFTIIDKKKSLFTTYYILPAIVLLATLGYGYYQLYHVPRSAHGTPIRISVIQGNIPQELKWQPMSHRFILDSYISLSKEAAKDKPDLIIWPEASSPGFLGQDNWIFENIFGAAKYLDINLLLGTVTFQDNNYFNSAILVDNNGKVVERYDKIHLVPFGEYIPLKKMFVFLETAVPIGDFVAGKEYTLFSLDSRLEARDPRKFAVLICFEDIFPELSRQFVKKGADFLVNITNDAWFGKTSSPYQHLSASVFRAVENRVFLMRAANTGISGFINPVGKIISTVADRKEGEIFVSGYKSQEILPQKREGITFYARYGDISVLLLCILALYGIMFRKYGQK